MSVSVRENIFVNLKTVLATITVANGYANTIASVQRWLQHGNLLKSAPAVIIKAGPETKSPARSYNLTDCHLSVMLDLWIREAETSTDDSEVVMNSLFCDIEKALTLDITRGGYARDTRIVSATPFETMEGEPLFGLAIELEIIYAHKQTDPFTKG